MIVASLPLVESFRNAEDNLTAFVFLNPAGKYNVIRDDDSGEFLSVAYVGVSLAVAITRAKQFCNIK